MDRTTREVPGQIAIGILAIALFAGGIAGVTYLMQRFNFFGWMFTQSYNHPVATGLAILVSGAALLEIGRRMFVRA